MFSQASSNMNISFWSLHGFLVACMVSALGCARISELPFDESSAAKSELEAPCTRRGDVCSPNRSCCFGSEPSTMNGICICQSSQCREEGKSCSSPRDCCSTYCLNNVCAPYPQCAGPGFDCRKSSAGCCPVAGGDPPQCGVTGDCQSACQVSNQKCEYDFDCCLGQECQNKVCRQVCASGTENCLGQPCCDANKVCSASGACQIRCEDSDTTLKDCKSYADCCTNQQCVEGKCRAPETPAACAPRGSPCEQGSECCADTENPGQEQVCYLGKCGCKHLGEACSVGGQCCRVANASVGCFDGMCRIYREHREACGLAAECVPEYPLCEDDPCTAGKENVCLNAADLLACPSSGGNSESGGGGSGGSGGSNSGGCNVAAAANNCDEPQLKYQPNCRCEVNLQTCTCACKCWR